MNRRSHCNTCGHKLEVLDLFPIFSYIFTLGKCRHCGAKFSSRYLLVEIFSGIIFMGLFYKIFFGVLDSEFLINFISLTFIFSGLILIFLFDLKHKIIPNLVIYPLYVLSLIYLFFNNLLNLEVILYAIV
ncbi:MAG TPA: prepilin peptidase [Candidatus Pacebacteria bacterium]|nr:prepilin peptidase [Candidatus Paceibacterota bacterium]